MGTRIDDLPSKVGLPPSGRPQNPIGLPGHSKAVCSASPVRPFPFQPCFFLLLLVLSLFLLLKFIRCRPLCAQQRPDSFTPCLHAVSVKKSTVPVVAPIPATGWVASLLSKVRQDRGCGVAAARVSPKPSRKTVVFWYSKDWRRLPPASGVSPLGGVTGSAGSIGVRRSFLHVCRSIPHRGYLECFMVSLLAGPSGDLPSRRQMPCRSAP